jgi:hypothetical protein
MKRQSQWAAHRQHDARPRLDQSAYRLRFGNRAWRVALVSVLSLMIGCSCSKPGDGKTRWTGVDKSGSHREGDR